MSNLKVAYIECIGKSGGERFRVDAERVKFRVDSSMSQTPNTMSISMFGLSEYDAGRVISRAKTVSLIAGSDGSTGLIGHGQVVMARNVDSPDGYSLNITAVDGDAFYALPYNRTISGGSNLKTLVEALISTSNGTVGVGHISQRASEIVLPRGFSIIGTVIPTIRNVAKQVNATFYVNQGLVYLVCPDELIGVPVQLSEDEMAGEPTFDGYYVTFAHDIQSGIRVGNSVIFPREDYGGGMYRVLSISAEGDTRGPIWKMTVDGAEQREGGLAQEAITCNIWR